MNMAGMSDRMPVDVVVKHGAGRKVTGCVRCWRGGGGVGSAEAVGRERNRAKRVEPHGALCRLCRRDTGGKEPPVLPSAQPSGTEGKAVPRR